MASRHAPQADPQTACGAPADTMRRRCNGPLEFRRKRRP
jgi:hypothetical protein